ncbi:MAG: SPOR domain-containing protein [Candidatus Krumholzibacteriales bacterium]
MILPSRIRNVAAIAFGFSFILGCAAGNTDRAAEPAAESDRDVPGQAESRGASVPGDESEPDKVYDIEEELPENRELKETEKIEEKITVQEKDSLPVEEVESAPVVEKTHGLGYRVQIFASEDLEKAREIKSAAQERTALKVYIEYENQMYKVRVGDFDTREEAAEMRQRLKSSYPDCWITETTIRK